MSTVMSIPSPELGDSLKMPDTAKTAEELGELLSAFESGSSSVEKPDIPDDNVALLARITQCMIQLSWTPDLSEWLMRLASLVTLPEEMWITYFDITINEKPLSLDAFVQVLEHFEQAEKGYLSINLLLRHAQLLLDSYGPGATAVEEDVSTFLTSETLRTMWRSLMFKSKGLLSESQILWQKWIDWEVEVLKASSPSEKQEQIDQIHKIYLARLSEPHTTIDATASSYSSFCTQYSPEDYEQRLVAATMASQSARTKLSSEKRHGKMREDLELELASASDPATVAQVYVTYIRWETDPKAKKKGSGNTPVTDPFLTSAIFERAVAAYARLAADSGGWLAESPPVAALAYKDAEAALWTRYSAWTADQMSLKEATAVCERAVRACPQSISVWVDLLNNIELRDSDPNDDGVEQGDYAVAFKQALGYGLLTSRPGFGFTELFVVRAGCQRRLQQRLPAAEFWEHDELDYHPIMETLRWGLELVQKADKAGDPALTMEKFFMEWAVLEFEGEPVFLKDALKYIDKPNKCRLTSYQFITRRAAVAAVFQEDIDYARKLYLAAIQRSDLDWPEAVYEAFKQFENIHGSIDSILAANKAIAKEEEKLNRRRQKQANEQLAQYYGAQATTAAAPVQDLDQSAIEVDVPVQVIAASSTVVATSAGPEKAEEGGSNLKRDREHTSILITGLPKAIDEARLATLFESAGDIRETTIIPDTEGDTASALVEFRSAEAIPFALSRDGRDVDEREIAVSMLWRSTLFVTNFPRDMDDTAMRTLFGNYGKILQTRWPSRKYAADRKFCYITMGSPASAEEACVMNGYKPDPEARFGLNVLISDPAAKNKRSDEAKSTLFVGGLSSKTTEQDVRKEFSKFGTVRHVKLGWDPVKGICKGFAFVDMASDAEAEAALVLDGEKRHGKKLKVEKSDPTLRNKKAEEVAAKQEERVNSIRVRLEGLPEGVQEGLLQQALEKVVSVKRVELFVKTHHAVAELETRDDLQKMLAFTEDEPFTFQDQPISISEVGPKKDRGPRPQSATQFQPKPSASAVEVDLSVSSLTFAPRAAKKGTKPILGKPRPAPAPAASAAKTNGAGPSSEGQNSFRAMVAATNKEREGKLASVSGSGGKEKRPAEDGQGSGSGSSKRTRMDWDENGGQ